mgnify:CR=1 FL=1
MPESVDDYVGPENPVRFIDAFVDGLDLTLAGFARVVANLTGRPGYAPKDLLKLYIYGYLNRVRSSRRLEAETHRNIEVIWLLRHLKPDFKTIADFRPANRNAFRPIFRQFVLLCRQLDLFGRELIAVDGTRIKAVNNKDRHFTRASLTTFLKLADPKLDDYLQRLDQSARAEGAPGGPQGQHLHRQADQPVERHQRVEIEVGPLRVEQQVGMERVRPMQERRGEPPQVPRLLPAVLSVAGDRRGHLPYQRPGQRRRRQRIAEQHQAEPAECGVRSAECGVLIRRLHAALPSLVICMALL